MSSIQASLTGLPSAPKPPYSISWFGAVSCIGQSSGCLLVLSIQGDQGSLGDFPAQPTTCMARGRKSPKSWRRLGEGVPGKQARDGPQVASTQQHECSWLFLVVTGIREWTACSLLHCAKLLYRHSRNERQGRCPGCIVKDHCDITLV